ncbi:MAG: hypothetical protein D4S01_03650 [Dehalococcoidia bacterium]|nr:MAG: hypothetical protein D4S01_03650 [Dehalococcoidia bacterium]
MRRFFISGLIVLGLVAGVLLSPAAALAAFGIDPGKVYIDNLYPGARAEFPITIYNQNDYEATFVVRAREPDYTAEDKGYDALPHLEWVTATPSRVIIGASDKDEVLVTVAMPEDADYSGKKSEVWISFMEEGTAGMIRIELCSRIFVSTRVEEPEKTETETPAVEGGGGVGITAEAGEPGPVPPEAEPGSPWAILGPVIGVVIVGGVVFFLVKRRQRA